MADDFDPDAYLSAPAKEPSFDPDAYLGNSKEAPSYLDTLKSSVTGLPGKIKEAGSAALSTINDTLNPLSEANQKAAEERTKNPLLALTDWTRAGQGLAAIPELAGAPLTGVVKSAAPAIAQPMTNAIQAAGEPIAKKLNPKAELPSYSDVYNKVEPDVEQALSVAMPGKAKVGKTGVPSLQQLYDAADGDYSVARSMDVNVHPDSVRNFAQTFQAGLEKDGMRDYLAPKTFAALKEMQNPPSGSMANLADIDGMRKVFGHAAGDFANPTEQKAASMAIRALDDYSRNIPSSDVLSGDLPAAQRVLESARSNYAAAKRAELIEGKEDAAVRQAQVTGSGANINNALRQKMNSILNSPKQLRGFNQEEQDLIKQIASGTPVGNLARRIGKLAPTGIISGTLGIELGHALLGGIPMGEAIPMVVGSIAKHIGDASTVSGVKKLSEAVRERSSLGNQLKTIPPRTPKQQVSPASMVLPSPMRAFKNVSVPQLPVPLAAQSNQNNVPGVPEEHHAGGAVEAEQGFAQGGSVTVKKHTKAEADYKAGTKAKECSQCQKFIAPRGCKGVSGLISPHGVCKYFVREE